jgi:uncharacterized protein
MPNPVRSHKLKFDGTSKGPWHGDLVEVHPDGWLVVFYERPPQVTSDGVQPAYGLRYHGTALPLGVLVYFDERGGILEYHCDAALAATIEGRDIRFIDLDIDLIVGPDFLCFERDHEDFERNRSLMGYPEHVVAAARAGIEAARKLLVERATPFDGHPCALLGRVLAAQGPV